MNTRFGRLDATVQYLSSLRRTSSSWFSRFESSLTGGLYWKAKARRTETELLRRTEGKWEISLDAESELQDRLVTEQDRANYGVEVSESARDTLDELHSNGFSSPRIKAWFATRQISQDGHVSPNKRRERLVCVLGWSWHLIVLITALLFLVLTWALPGAVWKKVILSAVEVLFFLVMAALMNSRSLSALPPRRLSNRSD